MTVRGGGDPARQSRRQRREARHQFVFALLRDDPGPVTPPPPEQLSEGDARPWPSSSGASRGGGTTWRGPPDFVRGGGQDAPPPPHGRPSDAAPPPSGGPPPRFSGREQLASPFPPPCGGAVRSMVVGVGVQSPRPSPNLSPGRAGEGRTRLRPPNSGRDKEDPYSSWRVPAPSFTRGVRLARRSFGGQASGRARRRGQAARHQRAAAAFGVARHLGRTQRFENWKLRRAFLWPYFLRSTTRASRVRKPSFFSSGRRPGS